MSVDEETIEFEPVILEDPKEVGSIVIGWMEAKGPTIPRTGPIQVLIDALGGSNKVKLPSTFKTYQIFDGDDEVFQFRLPPPKLTKAGLERACVTLEPGEDYDPPPFYRVKICNDMMNHCDFFMCRVADYTMQMCK